MCTLFFFFFFIKEKVSAEEVQSLVQAFLLLGLIKGSIPDSYSCASSLLFQISINIYFEHRILCVVFCFFFSKGKGFCRGKNFQLDVKM